MLTSFLHFFCICLAYYFNLKPVDNVVLYKRQKIRKHKYFRSRVTADFDFRSSCLPVGRIRAFRGNVEYWRYHIMGKSWNSAIQLKRLCLVMKFLQFNVLMWVSPDNNITWSLFTSWKVSFGRRRSEVTDGISWCEAITGIVGYEDIWCWELFKQDCDGSTMMINYKIFAKCCFA